LNVFLSKIALKLTEGRQHFPGSKYPKDPRFFRKGEGRGNGRRVERKGWRRMVGSTIVWGGNELTGRRGWDGKGRREDRIGQSSSFYASHISFLIILITKPYFPLQKV